MDKFYKNCDCSGWKTNCEILDNALMMALNHGQQGLQDSFLYCPWCGKVLEQEKSE